MAMGFGEAMMNAYQIFSTYRIGYYATNENREAEV